MPERTCVICRRRSEKTELLRVVFAGDGGLVVDGEQRVSSRSAYCCTEVRCLGARELGPRLISSIERGSASPKKSRGIAKASSQRSKETLRFLNEPHAGLLLMEEALRYAQDKGARKKLHPGVRRLNELNELLRQPKAAAVVRKKRASHIRL